ncbi:MAG: polysaccharide lyase family 8 super-sandwich domain-containing protein, partial [Candidatus Cryptobacteroides sp.]
SGNNLMKGLLTDDEPLVEEACRQIAEEIRIADTDEGIQSDWSFHQHGPQIQTGNYGLAYADGLTFWMRVLKDSPYDFTSGQKDILTGFMKEGLCWSVWKGLMDPNHCGRQNFIDAGVGKAYALAVAASNMARASEEDSVFFANVAREILQSDKFSNTLVGNRYYDCSDCGIHRSREWYASVRMHSERTIGFEFTNRENTLANFSADGAVLAMVSGREYENIFACWDWRKVPGVTAYDDGKPIKCDDSIEGKRNGSAHVGGLVCDGVMAATMELDRDGLVALKSSFFFDDCVVALGCGISVADSTDFVGVTTSIDQKLLDGKVSRGRNWVHNGRTGYLSLDGQSILHSKGRKKGDWGKIDPALSGVTDSRKVFSCWFEHGPHCRDASYSYMILPCADAGMTARAAEELSSAGASVRVIRNDKACQAVSRHSTLVAVFHEAGTYHLDGQTFVAETPGIVMAGPSGRKSVAVPEKSHRAEPRESSDREFEETTRKVFKRAEAQFSLMERELDSTSTATGKTVFPRTVDAGGHFVTSPVRWWCSGFYPGSLWYLYEYSRDHSVQETALRRTGMLESLRHRGDDHDVGFQIMCSYGSAYRILGDTSLASVIVDAAKALSTRFNPAVGCTRSWSFGKWSFPVIIDNMMNMELLLKASELLAGSDPAESSRLREIALSHARTTMKNHFRQDHSCFHLVDYNPENGEVVHRQTVQGFADSSAWSRGQAWAVYGYAMMYEYTSEADMLNHAVAVADYVLSRLPEDCIPYWDYDSDLIPDDLRDASAAAVTAAGLLRLAPSVDAEKAERYRGTARKILLRLAGDDYLVPEGGCHGFLLRHSVGSKPGNSEVDVPLTYADYYYLEALLKYLRQ